MSKTPLESKARSLLASSIRILTNNHDINNNDDDNDDDFVYPSPCSGLLPDANNNIHIAESSTTLLAARTIAKLGRADLSWQFLKTLFAAQGSNGFLPRFVYLNNHQSSMTVDNLDGIATTGIPEGMDSYFIGPFPGPKLFDHVLKGRAPLQPHQNNQNNQRKHNHQNSQNQNQADRSSIKIWSSGSIMAPPHHATTILEVFYLSNQTKSDVNHLGNYFTKLLDWHSFLHEEIISNCTAPSTTASTTDSYSSSSKDSSSSHSSSNNNNADTDYNKNETTKLTTYFPCLPIHHPWETEIDSASPIWTHALQNITQSIKTSGWTPNLDIPPPVKNAFDYPGEEQYHSILYLLDCLNLGQGGSKKKLETMRQLQNKEELQHQQQQNLQNQKQQWKRNKSNISSTTSPPPPPPTCPQFAMLDVGFTSALSKSDQDLIQIGQILMDKNYILPPSWEHVQLMIAMSHKSRSMLRHLWEDGRGMFLNQMVDRVVDDVDENDGGKDDKEGNYDNNNNNGGATTGTFYTTPLDLPLGYNFEALWEPLDNSTMMQRMSNQLLQRMGNFSFSCGDYPLWSVGGCGGNSHGDTIANNGTTATQWVEYGEEDDGLTSAKILPLLNYRVSKGLQRNNEAGIGHYLQASTLNLICGLLNTADDSNLNNCNTSLFFADAYDASSNHLPLGNKNNMNNNDGDECSLSSTLTAAIALDMLLPDKAFHYESEPPISSSSVIFLIAVELVVAFGIGVSCLLLSLNLMRRITADDEGTDAFIQIVQREEQDRRDEEEVLIGQLSAEDMPPAILPFDVSDHDNDDFGMLQWSARLVSRLNPMNLLEKRRTH